MTITVKVEELLSPVLYDTFFMQHLVSGSVCYPFFFGDVCSYTD